MASEKRKIKVLLAKMGLDYHDTGVKVVASMLRDAGMEVTYLGLFNFAEHIVAAAIEEDADVIGVSFLVSTYLRHTADLMKMLREKGIKALVVCGGTIKKKDVAKLKKLGVAEVFLPGSTGKEIADFINRSVALVSRE